MRKNKSYVLHISYTDIKYLTTVWLFSYNHRLSKFKFLPQKNILYVVFWVFFSLIFLTSSGEKWLDSILCFRTQKVSWGSGPHAPSVCASGSHCLASFLPKPKHPAWILATLVSDGHYQLEWAWEVRPVANVKELIFKLSK